MLRVEGSAGRNLQGSRAQRSISFDDFLAIEGFEIVLDANTNRIKGATLQFVSGFIDGKAS